MSLAMFFPNATYHTVYSRVLIPRVVSTQKRRDGETSQRVANDDEVRQCEL